MGNRKRIAEFAFDIQSGLEGMDIPDFDQLRIIGMAATLAVHIRGLGEIDYEILRKVSDYYFDIPSYALKDVLNILDEIEFVQIIAVGKKIKTIIPQVPHFSDIYETLDEYVDSDDLNEHEQATLIILGELFSKPENVDSLINKTNIDKGIFTRCMDIGKSGGYIREHRARGKTIIVSPYYFADNLESLADIAAKSGSSEIEKVLSIIHKNQGWPISLIESRAEIGGIQLSKTQLALIKTMSQEAILKPPTIKYGTREESFIFTPRPGKVRLNASNREIYERSMALISSVRKGQLLPEQYKIKMPLRILEALRDRGYLKASSEAPIQYKNLFFMRVAHLKHVGGNMYQLHLNDTDENKSALDLAISLLRTGDISNLEVNQDARIALVKDEKYIQSIVAASELRKREKQQIDEHAAYEFEQLMLQY